MCRQPPGVGVGGGLPPGNPQRGGEEAGGGRAGQGNGVQGEGGSSSSTAFAVTLPVAADACGDQRCEMEWTDGQTVGTLSLCCPEPQTRREGAAARFLTDLRDVHKGKVLCGLWSGVPRAPGGRKGSSVS